MAAVGRDRKGPYHALIEDYRRRCPWPVTVHEVPLGTATSIERRLDEEAARLMKPLASDAVIVALDAGGRDLSSAAFAGLLQAWREQGRADIAFVIGGPDGLAPSVLDRATATIAFGRMTWPHRLARVMLLEQLYRAAMILGGHPYHRD